MGLDLKYLYLNTPMDQPEFLRIKLSNSQEDVIEQYKLQEKVDDKLFLYVKSVCGMYGLPHAGFISQNCSKNGSKIMAAARVIRLRVSGNTICDQSASHS